MSEKITRVVQIGSAHGLHARPAKMFVEVAKGAGFPIEVASSSGKSVNAASILGVISLGANQGDEITITGETDRPDVNDVFDELERILVTDHDAE